MVLRVLYMFLLLPLLFIQENRLVFVNGVGPNTSIRPKNVNIGALFSFNSTIGKVAKIAIQAAIDDVNSSSDVLHGTHLNITMLDNCQNVFLGIVQTMEFIQNDIVAIVGPQSSGLAHILSPVVEALKVPLLSFATDPNLSSMEDPFVVQTTPSDVYQMDAIADLINYFGWREVTAIYTDDNYGRNGIASLGDRLAENLCKITYRVSMSMDVEIDKIETLLMEAMLQESRIFVLHTHHDQGLKVLEVARALLMFENGFVWIATSWLTDVFETHSPLPSNIQTNIQGLLTLRVHTPNSNRNINFASKWSNLLRKDHENNPFGLNTYGLYAYDSVWILARALEAYFSQGGSISFSKISTMNHQMDNRNLDLDPIKVFDGGEDLLFKLYQVNMTGLTGHIQFDQDKRLIKPVFEIINIVGGLNRIGYWSHISGLTHKLPEAIHSKTTNQSSHRLLNVIWPGYTMDKPRGWVYQSHGKVLKIGVPRRLSYHEFVSYSNETHSFSGYSIDVFLAALNLLPYSVAYDLIPFGDGLHNPKIDLLIELLSQGVYDAVVGDIIITSKRARKVCFTQPIIESGLVVVAPVKHKDPNAWFFLWPMSLSLWCVTIISTIVVVAVIWTLEHRFNDDFRGPPRHQVKTCLWFSCLVWFGTNRETTITALGRFVLFIWFTIILLIKSSYNASLSSICTLRGLESPIKGIESLMGSKLPIGYQQGSFSENYLRKELNFSKSQLIPLNNEEEYAKALEKGPKNGGVAAIVDDKSRIKHLLSKRCDFTIRGQKFNRFGKGFAFPQGSELAVDMSTAILKLTATGELERIKDKWLTDRICSSENTKLTDDRLDLDGFLGLFFLCGLACVFALIINFVQLMIKFKRHQILTKDKSNSQTPQDSWFKTFVTFVIEGEDEP
ncbi:unnamed protein product [Amaranthus hypochondriacus]